jgi:hypothetical protein
MLEAIAAMFLVYATIALVAATWDYAMGDAE